MSFAPLLDAEPAILLHALAAMAAFALGLVQFAAPKGTLPHRTLGWIWVALMAAVAASSFWIHTIRLVGPWSPIHLLSIYTLAVLPLAVWEYSSGFVLAPDLLSIATLGYVIVFASTLAYLFFNRGISLIGPNRAAPFLHLVPLFGSVLAILLLGEELKAFHLAGYALVIAGVIIASRVPIRKPRTVEPPKP